MIEINHTPTEHEKNCYEICGGSINDIVDECLKRIRPQSKEFYKKELRKDLQNNSKSIIDRHAGMGVFYRVILK